MRNKLNRFLVMLLVCAVVLGVMPAIKAQPALPAIWVDPATLNFDIDTAHVGDKFNVTVWAGTTSDVFTYQVKVSFNVTHLTAVRAAYTGGTGSQWWKGNTTFPIGVAIDSTKGTVITGETLLSPAIVHASSGSICWIEFQIIAAPTAGNTLTSLIDTNFPDDSYLLSPDLGTIADVTLGHATYVFSGGGPPPTRHDVAIVSVTPSNDHPKQNDTISIDVVATNNGTEIETFDVNVTYGGTLIGTQTATALAAGASITLTFNWNTTGVTPAQYTITATATAVPGDADPSNNVKTAAVRVLSSAGPVTDVNGDSKVDMKDIGIVGKAFGEGPGDPRWDPVADVNGDEVVNLLDIALVSKDFRMS